MLAGGDRIEGCLFGNGERTGNVDIVNLALNLYTQGVSPGLDFSDLQTVIDTVTQCNDLPIHPRYPYAGDLVFTAFSGSHQDAIKKGFEAQKTRHAQAEEGAPKYWDIPYLPIDPADLGQNYEAVIRVNSQSGKGGIAYLVKQHLHLDMPRKMQIAFYQVVQAISDREAREMTVDDITTAFRKTYHFGGSKYAGRLALRNFKISNEPSDDPAESSGDETPDERRRFDGTVAVDGVYRVIRGNGNGPLSSLLNALKTHLDLDFAIRDYIEHTVGEGEASKAASYIEIVPASDRKSSTSWWGVGLDSDIAGSGLRALISAVNTAVGDRALPELKLSVGFSARSGQEDIANIIVNALGLELPRRLQTKFFEEVQRTARESGGEISYESLTNLFKKSYRFGNGDQETAPFSLGSFKLENIGGSARQFVGDILFNGKAVAATGEGNGPLSSAIAALHPHIEGVLSIREYSEHSLGEGSEVRAASYVELSYEVPGSKKRTAWGIGVDTDITASGIRAVLNAASSLEVVSKVAANGA